MNSASLLVNDRYSFLWQQENGRVRLGSVVDGVGGNTLELQSTREHWVEGRTEEGAIDEELWTDEIESADEERIVIRTRHQAIPLEARIDISVDHVLFGLRKSVHVTWRGSGPLTIVRMGLGAYRVGQSVRGGGKGQPAVSDEVFLAVDHPCGYTEVVNDASAPPIVRLYHWPGVSLQAAGGVAVWKSQTQIIGVRADEATTDETLKRYVLQTAKHQEGVFTVYGDWANHDELGSPEAQFPLTEKQTLENVALLEEQYRVSGNRFDYYLIDHGWYDGAGDLTQLLWPNWPTKSFDQVRERLKAIGTQLGLWFSVNAFWSGESALPVGLAYNRDLDESRCGDERGHYCLSAGPYRNVFESALLHWARQGIAMFKFDFASFRCRHPHHGDLPIECAEEQEIDVFLQILSRVRQEAPNVKFVIFNGFPQSPWWFRHVDTAYVGDVQPCETPTMHLRASTILFDCIKLREFEGKYCPRPLLDDCGVMFGPTATIFYLGLEGLRATALVNMGRGLCAHWYYGSIADFSEQDWNFVWQVLHRAKAGAEDLREPMLVGDLRGEAPYAYVHAKAGLAVAYNPTVKRQSITLSEPHGTGADIAVALAPYEAQLVNTQSGAVLLSSMSGATTKSAEHDRLPLIQDGIELECTDLGRGADGNRVRVSLEAPALTTRPQGLGVVVYFTLWTPGADGGEPIPWRPPRGRDFHFRVRSSLGDALSHTPVPKRPAWNRPPWVACVVTLPSSEWGAPSNQKRRSQWLDVTVHYPHSDAPELSFVARAQAYWP